MPFCTRTPTGSPPPDLEELRRRTEAFVREVLPSLDEDPIAFECTVSAIIEQFEFVLTFSHAV